MNTALFLFDWGASALIFRDPHTDRPMAITTDALRSGWQCTDEAMRKGLPRADASKILRIG